MNERMHATLPPAPEGRPDPDRHPESRSVGHAGAQRSLTLMRESTTIAPRELDARGIIRPDMHDRRQADAFRDLRTKLLALGRGRNFVTLVAPVSDGCGCATVATNLAAAFAFDGSKSALLIDCNLREPSLHRHLGVEPVSGGLVELLEHSDVDVERIIYPTGIARLRMIPAGERRESGAEYFSSYRMRGLIDSLRGRYADRYIVIESAPVQSAPDARILAELVDLVVVVAGYGRNTVDAVQAAVANFDPARLAGVVFNGVPPGVA
jgi:protein-tyrosine kinase